MTYVVIENGKREVRDGVPSLEELQELVGGLVDCVRLRTDGKRSIDLWVNDEGLLVGLAPNVVPIFGDYMGDPLVGPVVVTASNDEGETVGLNLAELAGLSVGPDCLINLATGTIIPFLRARILGMPMVVDAQGNEVRLQPAADPNLN